MLNCIGKSLFTDKMGEYSVYGTFLYFMIWR